MPFLGAADYRRFVHQTAIFAEINLSLKLGLFAVSNLFGRGGNLSLRWPLFACME